MSIIRAARPQSNFYILDKRISEDKRLSWAARGLLIFLLGKPDHWKVSVKHLQNETAESSKPTRRDATYVILDELISTGYVERKQLMSDGGLFGEIDYVVYDYPQSQPITDFPDTVRPDTVKPTLVSTDVKQGLKEVTMSGKPDDTATTLLEYLNSKTKQHFRAVESNLGLLQARLKEGATPEDVRAVIDAKVSEWLEDKAMRQYLRPKTLFNASNFNQYVGQLASNDVKTASRWGYLK